MPTREHASLTAIRATSKLSHESAGQLMRAGAHRCSCGKTATTTHRSLTTGIEHHCPTCALNARLNLQLTSLKATPRPGRR